MAKSPVSQGRVLVLLNAASGTGIDAETLDYLRAHASARVSSYELVVVDEPDASSLLARARQEIARGVIAVVVRGGDGMVQLGVNLVAGTRIPLGIVPAGSGNHFARSAGIPYSRRSRTEQLDRLLRALEHPDAFTESVDAMRVRCGDREVWAANSVNFGFDALVNERANLLRRVPGTLRYIAAILLVTRSFEAREFVVKFDDEDAATREVTLVAALNGKSMGGGIKVAPQADLADGLLDVLTVASLPRVGFLAVFPSAMIGMHTLLPQVALRRVRRMKVVGPAELPVYADGEPLGHGGFEVEVVPGAWRLLRA